jgi:hypothetical protein
MSYDPEATSGPRTDMDAAREPRTEDIAGVRETAPEPQAAAAEDLATEGGEALLPPEDTARMQGRWREIQGRFVDEPRDAVQAADALVAELMQALAGRFAEHRSGLEQQWQRGEDVGTEELRVALRQYRAFFDRLLSA